MDKRPALKEAKKNEIVKAALELFFENGYDGTSVRMIQRKVGNQAGLFYYYFKSKDDVFGDVIEMFFVPYEQRMREIVDGGKEKSDRELTKFIDYICEATQEFREQYLQKLHWSILSAIREHTLLIMKKYIHEILENYLEKGVIRSLPVSADVAANLISFGVGGSILYQNGEEYAGQRQEVGAMVSTLLGSPENY